MSHPFVAKINAITNGQCVLAGLVVSGLYYAMYFESGETIEKKISDTASQVKITENKYRSLLQAEEDAKRYKAVIAQMGEQLQEVIQYIPEKLNDFDLIDLLSSEARAAGANISNVTTVSPGVAQPGSIYEEVIVAVELNTTYTQLLQFLAFITRTDKIIILKSANINSTQEQSANGDKVLKFRGEFIGYRYKSDEKGGA